MSLPLGFWMVAFGAPLAAWRYFAVVRQIAADRVRPDRALIVITTVIVLFLAAATFLHLPYTPEGAPTTEALSCLAYAA